MPNKMSCHICCSTLELKLDTFKDIKFISSDLKLIDSFVEVYYCSNCNNFVKNVDENYRYRLEKLYKNYSLYSDTGMSDQLIRLDKITVSRSSKIISEITQLVYIPEQGKLLDYGSGKGAFASNWVNTFPSWEVTAFDQNVSTDSKMRVKNVSDPNLISEENDFVSLIHVLEHIINPRKLLLNLHTLIKEGGYLFIQVPNHLKNPYDLTIFDHCSHFNINSIAELVSLCGFNVIEKNDNWVNKEISLLAQKKSRIVSEYFSRLEMSRNPFVYLDSVLKYLNSYTIINLGFLGATNPAYWLSVQTNGVNKFFLDENKDEDFESTLNGKQIISLSEVQKNSVIFIPFVREYAGPISKRLKNIMISNFYFDTW